MFHCTLHTPLCLTLHPFSPFSVSLCTLLYPCTLLSVSFSMPPWPFVSLHTPCMLCIIHVSLCPTLHTSVPLFLLHITLHVYQFILVFICVPLCATLHPACLYHSAPIYVICTPALNSSIPLSNPLLPLSVSLCIPLYLSLCCCAPLHNPLCVVLSPLGMPLHTSVSTPSVTYVQPLHFSNI